MKNTKNNTSNTNKFAFIRSSKNIYKVGDRYITRITRNGKRTYKSFEKRKEAIAYRDNY